MSLLIYAITDGPLSTGSRGSGVAGSPVRTVGDETLLALVSEHDSAPRLTEDALWAFDAVIESEMAGRALLPARFGSIVEDREALETLLAERREELTVRLGRVRGAVELGVRATWLDAGASPPPDAVAEPPAGRSRGSAYMQERVTRIRHARDLAARVDGVLGPLSRAGRCRILNRRDEPVSAAYLVDREGVARFAAAVSELQADIEDAVLTCTGPWPPYSFAEGSSDD